MTNDTSSAAAQNVNRSTPVDPADPRQRRKQLGKQERECALVSMCRGINSKVQTGQQRAGVHLLSTRSQVQGGQAPQSGGCALTRSCLDQTANWPWPWPWQAEVSAKAGQQATRLISTPVCLSGHQCNDTDML
jgi:hypothetical protein